MSVKLFARLANPQGLSRTFPSFGSSFRAIMEGDAGPLKKIEFEVFGKVQG